MSGRLADRNIWDVLDETGMSLHVSKSQTWNRQRTFRNIVFQLEDLSTTLETFTAFANVNDRPHGASHPAAAIVFHPIFCFSAAR